MSPRWARIKKWFRSMGFLWKKLPEGSEAYAPFAGSPQLSSLKLKNMMIPRSDIVAVDHKAPFEEVLNLLIKTRFEALPVFRETLDQIVGLIDVHRGLEVFREGGGEWTEKIHPAFFAAASMQAFEAILEMQKRDVPFVLIVDEYGGIDGLVSRYEILSALMEHLKLIEGGEETEDIVYGEDGVPLLDGRLSLEGFHEFLGNTVPDLNTNVDPEIETIGGFVCHLAGRVPFKGEIIFHPSGLTFEVVDADPRKIKQLSVRFSPIPTVQASDVTAA